MRVTNFGPDQDAIVIETVEGKITIERLEDGMINVRVEDDGEVKIHTFLSMTPHSSDLCDECKCLLEDDDHAGHCSLNPNNFV